MNGAELLLIVLVGVSLVGIMAQSIIVLRDRRHQYAVHHKTVLATITRIDEEVGAWYITATWLDEKEQRLYSFRSPPFEPPTTLRVGETATVTFDIANPLRYQMSL